MKRLLSTGAATLLVCGALGLPTLAQGPPESNSPPSPQASRPALDETDRAARLLESRFRSTAATGLKEGLPIRTLNARPRAGLDRLAPPPAPGEGRPLRVRSFAYCLQGFTARGTRVQLGTAAVDPSVIPLGSTLYVPGYGWARALDTGGAICGHTIDLWFPTLGQCYQWGTRSVDIVVFPPAR